MLLFRPRLDLASPLTFKGVVYNEMKGAMSDTESLFATRLEQAMFAKSALPYRWVSGGDPVDIPSLSHSDLVAFYKKHYHPSQAHFFSYGNPKHTHTHT